jgi:uncharacterized membrane protein YeaQ/YmgE (transglycosylase-associated protein family)
MTLLYLLIIGAIAGWITGLITKGKSHGIIINIMLGVLGAVVGSWIFKLLGIRTSGGLFGELLTAVIGAVILVWAARQIKR